MENIPDSNFANSGIINNSERFFVSLWAELFNKSTIDTYRVRVMNARSILTELDEVINDRANEETHLNNVYYVCQEAIRILKNDPICSKHFIAETSYVVKCLKKTDDELKKIKDLKALIHKVRILQKELEENYLKLLIKDLGEAIFDSDDLSKTLVLTNSLATELIQSGYSFEYLYRRKFLFLDGQSGRTFKERWTQFAGDIREPSRSFRVLLKFHGCGDLAGMEEAFNIKIDTNFLKKLNTEEESKFESLVGTYIGTIANIAAPDPYSAAYKALNNFWFLEDLIRFEFRTSEVLLTQKALIYDENDNSFLVELNRQPIGFQPSGRIERFQKYVESFNKVLDKDNKVLDRSSMERIRNSFRYFRMSLDSKFPESRFLHCWIALEFLMKTGSQSSIISPIIQFVPKILALKYLRKLVVDFSANLTRCKADRGILFRLGINESGGGYKLNELLSALKDPGKKEGLITACTDSLLRFRAEELCTMLAASANVKTRLAQHLEDVRWHLQRMYRTRNRIVHSASVGINLLQLKSNLSYYYDNIFSTLLYQAGNSSNPATLEKIMMNQEADFEYFSEKLESNSLTNDDILFP